MKETTSFQNSSILNIDGTLKAGGDINLNSTAGADISSVANVSFDKNKNTATSLAMNLALGNNQSYLVTSDTADINAGGKINISSLANSPVNVETSLKREGSGLGALTLSGVSINSSSLLESNGALTAKGNISVSSKYAAPTYKVNTEISVTKPVSGMEQTEEEEEKTQSTGSAISNFINGLQEEDSDGESTSTNDITSNATVVISKYNAYFGLGKVTSSSGNVNIEAANVINDPQIGAISVVPVEAGEGLTVTPVIVYSTIDNNSLINLKDDINAKSIKVKSNLSLDNPRLDQVKDDILEIKPQLENVGLSVGGHIIPKSLDTAATDIIIGVKTVNDVNAVQFSGNNALSGDNISITANNNINHLNLNDGSGKGVNNSYRAAGTVSYAGGTAQASIDVGAAPKITVKESLTVDAKNNTNIFNMAGGLSYGGGSASVGVGAAVNNFNVNTKAIVGNNKDSGSLNSKNVDVKATTDGMINSLSVAGGLSTSAGDNSSDNSSNNSSNRLMSYSANNLTADSVNTLAADDSTTDSEEPKSSGIELLDRIRDFVDSDIYETVSDVFQHFNDAKSTITDTKDKIDKAIDEKVSAVTGSKPDDVNINKTDELSSQESQPKVTFDGAGSVSINLGSRETQSTLTGLDASNLNTVNVGALDKNFTGAWSGAGALNFRGADSGKTSVALTGAVAVNKVDSNVIADISANKNLTGAINNTAEKSGALIAAGLGLTVSNASSESSNYTGAASANVMITNVGKELDSSYQSDTNKNRTEKDGSQVNVNENLQKANDSFVNKVIGGDNLKSGGMNIELVSDADKQVTAGGVENSGTHINISGAMNADKISVNNAGTNNLTQGLFTGSVGGVSVNGSVDILNL